MAGGFFVKPLPWASDDSPAQNLEEKKHAALAAMGTLVPGTALAVLKRNERTLQNPCCTSHHGGCTQQGGSPPATAEG